MGIRVIDSKTEIEIANLTQEIIRAQNIVVVVGAGISTSSGIPVSRNTSQADAVCCMSNIYQDFRSSNGLYRTQGAEIFDAQALLTSEKRAKWCMAMSKIKLEVVDRCKPSVVHWFLRMLDLKQKLLRLYSQNIDGLENVVGMVEPQTVSKGSYKGGVVLLHGNIHMLRCGICAFQTSWNAESTQSLRAGIQPDCPDCLRRGELSKDLDDPRPC
jgi:NAD-dependent histone deacetylase SIR2